MSNLTTTRTDIREGRFDDRFVRLYKDAGDAVKAASEYGVMVPGLVQRGNGFGAQFHPEKSGPVGLNILKAFGEESLC